MGSTAWLNDDQRQCREGGTGRGEKIQGQLLTLKYKDGEQKILIPPETPIVKNVPGDRSLLKPGTGVYIAAIRGEDGSLTAIRVTAGVGGIMPPM